MAEFLCHQKCEIKVSQTARKLSPEPPEQCYGGLGEVLQLSCSDATEALEKVYGVLRKKRNGCPATARKLLSARKRASWGAENSHIWRRQAFRCEIIECRERRCKDFWQRRRFPSLAPHAPQGAKKTMPPNSLTHKKVVSLPA